MKKIGCILLIDDNEADNLFHEIILKEAEVCNTIRSIKSGRKALDYLLKLNDPNQLESNPRPDLIYLDINMPGMNGFEFLEKYKIILKKLKFNCSIIILTTSLNPDDRTKAFTFQEVIDFQNKPLSADSVRKTIEQFF